MPAVLLVGCDHDDMDPNETLCASFAVHGPVAPNRVELAMARSRPFDAAVIDVDAGDAAYDLVLQLAEENEPCRSVVIGSHLDQFAVREAFLAGVVACLRKPVEARVLEGAVHRAVDATLVMRRCIQDAAVSMAAMETPSCPHDTSMLTPREQEILELLTHGRSTRSMAQALDVSQRTVKFHVSNVLRKLGADSRISLLAKLRRTSW